MIFETLNALWSHIPSPLRRRYKGLLVLMLGAGLAELVSVSALVPFLEVFLKPSSEISTRISTYLAKAFDIQRRDSLLIFVTCIFGFTVIAAAGLRLALLWVGIRLTYETGTMLSSAIYSRALYQDYNVHCSRNSSEIIDSISGKANSVVHSTILPAMTCLTSILMSFFIMTPLVIVDPQLFLATVGSIGIIYLIIIRLTRTRLGISGLVAARQSTVALKSIQEGLGGIREVILGGLQPNYIKIYQQSDRLLRRSQGTATFIGASPRYLLEACFLLAMAAGAYYFFSDSKTIDEYLPIIGAMMICTQRVVPLFQQTYASWSAVLVGHASALDALKWLDQPIKRVPDGSLVTKMPFLKKIELTNVSFKHSTKTRFVLRNLNLTINKGSRVGIIGNTGSGKSTLADLIMCLLSPVEGTLAIDGNTVSDENEMAWRKCIAHVSQVVYLADATIEANIAFGISEDSVDHERVRRAATQSQLSSAIESWPDQYKTMVGERGMRLSGGERQRIGIARALYKDADLIIFDESTNSLDRLTEEAIMQTIYQLNDKITVVIIAHNIDSLRHCSQIVEVVNGVATSHESSADPRMQKIS